MKNPLAASLVLAMVYIIIKLTVFNLEKSVELFVPMILLNIFLVLVAVIWGLKIWKGNQEKSEDNFLEDFKCAMRNVSVYALIISGFVYVYYAAIDKEFERKFNEYNVKNITKEQFEEIKKNDPVKMRDKTIDDFKKEKSFEKNLFTSPFMTTTMTLMGLVLIGVFYSIAIVLAWPKILSKLFNG